MLNDRDRNKKVITHRIACGRPGKPPQSLDYLEITSSEQPGPDAHFPVDVEAMEALLDFGSRYAVQYKDEQTGKPLPLKPRRIPIRVDSDNIDDFLPQEYRARVSLPVLGVDGKPLMVKGDRGDPDKPLTRLQVWCHGDGVQAHRRGKEGEAIIRCCPSPRLYEARAPDELAGMLRKSSLHHPEDGKRCPYAQNNDGRAGPSCKPETVLICRSDVVSNVGAFCRVRSHGHWTADTLRNSFDQIKAKMPGGILTDVPLDLVLTMKRMAVPGKTATKNQPVLHVELRLTVDDTVRLLNANLQQHLQIAESRRLLLASAVREAETEDVAEYTEGPPVIIGGAEGGGGITT